MNGLGMSDLVERTRAAAERRAEDLRSAVKARLSRALPGVKQEIDGDRIVLTGRNLVERWIASEAMRGLWDDAP